MSEIREPLTPIQRILLFGGLRIGGHRPGAGWYGVFGVTGSDDELGFVPSPFTYAMEFRDDDGNVTSVHAIDPTDDERQAIAALALHGQPFGFTWEDVDRARRRAEALAPPPGSGMVSRGMLDDWRYWLGLADRIEALLPPRE